MKTHPTRRQNRPPLGARREWSAFALRRMALERLEDRLLLADRFTRVTAYDLSTGQVADRRRPALSVLEKVYLFGVQPIYTVFPKPGEMSNVAAYLLTGSDSATVGVTNDLQAARPKLDIWTPIWSNLAFIAVVVGLGCLYTSRKDF